MYEADFEGPLMKKVMNHIDENPDMYDRHMTVDYSEFLDIIDYDGDISEIELNKITIELKEEIILANFGSFKVDW